MTAYTTIPDANLDPDSPARSVDVLALRDNPIAITEGASGAPKIENAAFQVVSAADTALCWRQPETTESTSTSYPALYEPIQSSSNIRVFCSGTIRVNCSHYGSGGATCYLRFLVNGSLDTEFTTTSATPVVKTADISVSYGDIISIQIRTSVGGASVFMESRTIKADSFFWVNSDRGV